MSGHLAIELLSSYMDEEVTARQLRLVEQHLDGCTECRRTLDGLRSVADSVRRLESVAPPSTLGVATERRLRLSALESERGLSLERSLGRWLGQPVLAPVFAVVLALGAILYLFSYGLAQRAQRPTRVVVASLPSEDADEAPSQGDEVAGAVMMDAAAAIEAERRDIPARQMAAAPSEDKKRQRAAKPEFGDTGGDAGEGILAEMSASAAEPRALESAELESDEVRARVRGQAVAAQAPAAAVADTAASIRSIEGRTFVAEDGAWIEVGLEGVSPIEVLDLSEGTAEIDPALKPFSELGRVRLRLQEQVVEVVYPD